MNETSSYEFLELEHSEELEPNENSFSRSQSENSMKRNALKVGILGCGAIANLILDFTLEEKFDVNLKCFYDRDVKRAKNIASKAHGTATLNINDMLDQVDLVIEAASPRAVMEIVPQILENGKDVIVMSVGALIDPKLRNQLEEMALRNNSRIYAPSGAIVGIDAIKAASIGEITEATLVTRKPPESLGFQQT